MNDPKQIVEFIKKVVVENPSQVALYDVLTNVAIDMIADGHSDEQVKQEIKRLLTPREKV